MTITKDMLKHEIDHIQDQYIDVLYMIIKAFEYPAIQRVSAHSPVTEAHRVRMLLFSVANRDNMRSETNCYEIRIGYEYLHLFP